MAYDESIAERVRDVLADVPGVEEKKMFGGLAFMVDGNMAVGPLGDGMIVRVGKENYEAALAMPGVGEMKFTGRPMSGFVAVEPDALESDSSMREWVERGVDYARSLPPK